MADWNWGGGGGGWGDMQDDDDDAKFEQNAGFGASKDCLVLLVDCSQRMFTPSNGEVPFQLTMKCARSVLLNKVISSERDCVGIVFFGTEKHKNGTDFKHVYIFQDMDTPDAPRIKQIEEMLDDDGFESFKTTYGHSGDFSLSDVLWTCSSMFAASTAKTSHKRILLFTNTDNPHATDAAKQRQAKTRAKDLAENGVEIELMHIGNTFDVSAFYQDIVFTGDDEVVALPNPAEQFEELMTRVRSKEFKKRVNLRTSLKLGPGLEIAVGLYNLVREAKKPSHVKLDQKTNEELKTQTKLICDDTGTELMPTDIKFYQELGGEKVVFEKEEVAEMKSLGEKGFTVMGFKPRSKIKDDHYVSPASFIYPSEKDVTGSTQLFSALLERCLAREVVAICSYIRTDGAAPVFIALIPQREEVDECRVQVSPPGFHVVPLPFMEDLRQLQYDDTPKASVEQINKAKDIIKKLTFKFESEAFENPALQKHYRQLEAIALEHEEVEPVADLTAVDTGMISKRAGKLLSEFKELIYSADYDPDKKPAAKRKAPTTSADGGGAAAKRSKTSDAVSEADVETAAKQGTLASFKVPDLKAYLKSVGLKTTGKKQDLIDSIKDHLGV